MVSTTVVSNAPSVILSYLLICGALHLNKMVLSQVPPGPAVPSAPQPGEPQPPSAPSAPPSEGGNSEGGNPGEAQPESPEGQGFGSGSFGGAAAIAVDPNKPHFCPQSEYWYDGICEQGCNGNVCATWPGFCICMEGLVRRESDRRCVQAQQCYSRCTDRHYLCNSWARRGECYINPGYMNVYCQASCNRCNDWIKR